jgi:hypothetical protein
MKTVKSALLGSKQLIDTNTDVLLMQLKEIIKEHRAVIITRLVAEIPTYMSYKFDLKPNKETHLRIKDKLMTLKHAGIDIKVYDNVVQQLLNRAVVHLTNEPFYIEIDEQLKEFAREKELNLR